MIALLLAAAAAVSDPTAPDPVSFSNIRFDAGHNWSIAQRAPRMVLQPTNEMFRTQARIAIEAAVPFAGTAEDGMSAAWTKALAGRSPLEDPARDGTRNVEVGGVVASMSAPVAPAGGVFVLAVKAGPKLTTLTVTADTDLAWALTAAFLGPILVSLEVVPDQPPPPGAVAGPAAPGPDPSDSFDWDGPDVFQYGIYDHGCLEPDDEYGELVRTAQGFVGAVRSRTVTYADAMATAKKVLAVPAARAQYDAAGDFASKEHPRRYVAGAATRALEGDPFGALAEFGLGGFGQVEMYRSGEWTLFMGPKVSGSVGGSGGSIKDGIWVKAAADGNVTELGGKISGEATMRTPGGDSVSAPVDEMVFNLLPEPPKPKRGPLRPYRGAIH